jgi:hypothetical protein
MLGSSWVAAQLVTSQEGFSSMKLVQIIIQFNSNFGVLTSNRSQSHPSRYFPIRSGNEKGTLSYRTFSQSATSTSKGPSYLMNFYFQGFFIFVAFTWTKKVRRGFRSQVSGDTKSSYTKKDKSCWSWSSNRTGQTESTEVGLPLKRKRSSLPCSVPCDRNWKRMKPKLILWHGSWKTGTVESEETAFNR